MAGRSRQCGLMGPGSRVVCIDATKSQKALSNRYDGDNRSSRRAYTYNPKPFTMNKCGDLAYSEILALTALALLKRADEIARCQHAVMGAGVRSSIARPICSTARSPAANQRRSRSVISIPPRADASKGRVQAIRDTARVAAYPGQRPVGKRARSIGLLVTPTGGAKRCHHSTKTKT